MKRLFAISALLACMGLFGATAHAALIDYDFSGNLTYHNDVQQFSFNVGQRSEVTVFSSSWYGGGFDLGLALWDAAGNLVASQGDGGRYGSRESNGVSYLYGNWDVFFNQALDPGDYIVTVYAYSNYFNSPTLADGFNLDNDPGILIADWSQPANGYKSPYFEFHILDVQPMAATPEPGTVLLTAIGLSALLLAYRRRNAAGRAWACH